MLPFCVLIFFQINESFTNHLKLIIMKKVIFLFLITITWSYSYGQCLDYTNPQLWTTIDQGDSLPVAHDAIVVSNSPRIFIDNSQNQVTYNNAPCGDNDIRVYQRLNQALCESWIAEFEFMITGVGGQNTVWNTITEWAGNKRLGFIPFAVTANSTNPIAQIDFTTNKNVANARTNNDALGIVIADGNTNPLNDINLSAFYKDGTNQVNACTIQILINTRYKVKLERIGQTAGRMTLFQVVPDATQETGFSYLQIGSTCCFSIPETVDSLKFVQHANNPLGATYRETTGWVNNTCIQNCFKEDACCFNGIVGPEEICADGSLYTYSIEDGADDYDWSVSPGVVIVSGHGTNTITIDASGATGDIWVSVDVECGCQQYSFTKTISILPSLVNDASFTYTTNVGSTLTLNVTPDIINSNITHTWNVYDGADCNDSTKPIAIPLVSRAPQGTGAASYQATNLDPSLCYVIEHIVCYNDGSCCEVKRRQVQNSFKTIPEGEGEIKNYTGPNDLQVFPNPTNGNVLSIKLLKADEFTIYIYDMHSRLITTKKASSNNVEVPLDAIPSGSYLVKVETTKGESFREMITVTK